MRNIFYKSIINPSADYPLTTLEKQFKELIIDASRSLIKMGSPEISSHFNINDNYVYNKFISWCHDNNEYTDWRLGISLIKYFHNMMLATKIKIIEELILLSCSQWTYMNKSKKTTIVIIYGGINEKLFCAEKSTQADKFREIFYIKIDKDNYPVEKNDFFFWELEDDDDIPKLPGVII
ncbi:hypothetical protein [Xenorhabdus littoralis]|uniref:hypothetical protein n=1 Tax=Xenorhabdus littoralis TaxID=2582835 RepID=UPI0029E7D14B|nr:hypothetical protein [Xenorhabdus sp. psl]MDX7989891.1 hypothetical protein [Xenorhabdus sp. psl]